MLAQWLDQCNIAIATFWITYTQLKKYNIYLILMQFSLHVEFTEPVYIVVGH